MNQTTSSKNTLLMETKSVAKEISQPDFMFDTVKHLILVAANFHGFYE